MILELDKIKDWLSKKSTSARLACLVIGIIFYVFIGAAYYKLKFSLPLLVAVCGTIMLVGLAFPGRDQTNNRFSRCSWVDAGIGLLLMLAHAPLYVFLSYDLPFQISTDEFVFIKISKELVNRPNPDLFGLCEQYFYFPTGSFLVNGFIAKYAGYFDLQTYRRIDGFFGLCIIFCGYFFFRIFYARKAAVFATVLLGCSHVLFGLSRMAMRENHCLLVELIALIALVYGLKQINARKLYVGGALLGILMYTYYAGRIVPLMWFIFLLIYCLKKYGGRKFLRKYVCLALPSIVGFLLVATPMFIASYKAPESASKYAKEQMLIYPEGRAFIQSWLGTNDLTTALLQNTVAGLSAFNSNSPDGGIIYRHDGNGFVDPLTGLFLWLGVFAVIKRKNKTIFGVFIISGFAFIWLFTSFLTNKNPSFTRLLVLLPFVVTLSFEGINFLATILAGFFVRARKLFYYKYRLITFLTVLTVSLNLYLYANYISKGLQDREVAGATMRYIDSRKNIANSHYYFASDEQHLYHWHGGYDWMDWIRLSTSPDQTVARLPPDLLINNSEQLNLLKPAVILLPNSLWEISREKIVRQFPNAVIYPITGNRKQIAVEIPD